MPERVLSLLELYGVGKGLPGEAEIGVGLRRGHLCLGSFGLVFNHDLAAVTRESMR
ncbi:hypothetical protein [Amycolatopsis sulphurea]|uniref:hypothetical protein n=1 Tax=Amycolatopsis sulphurea TaxID=76022 RepID=UPI00147378FF|nr:hypothetical protein [Amycolatopsis sulphurea]